MNLLEILERASTVAPEAVRDTGDDGSLKWSMDGRVFAVLAADGAVASFLLDPIVAGAAARTPNVTRSPRGQGWVDLAPATVDAHVADRATAWFLSAHRRLLGPGA